MLPDYRDRFRNPMEGIAASYAILNNLQEPIFVMNEHGKITWFNCACSELYHQVAEKHIFENFDFNELLTIKEYFPFRNNLYKTLAGTSTELEWHYKRPGVSKWLRLSLYPFYDDTGFTGVCGMLRDITEKKLNEQILLCNTSVLNNIDEGVLLTNADFHVMAFNRRAYEIAMEWGTEIRIGQDLLSYLPPNRRAIAAKNHAAALLGISAEYEARYPNNKWLLINFRPVLNKGKRIKQVTITFKDITEAKKVQAEIEVLSMIARETHNGVMIFDKQSGETVWINDGFTRLTGFGNSDIIGKNPVEVLQGPETDLQLLNDMTARIADNLPYDGDLVIYTKEGEKKLHHVTGQPFTSLNGMVAKYFVISTDITDRKCLEEERLRVEIESQREMARIVLETQEKARNQFGRELHDNISQILAAINMQVSRCLNGYEDGKPILQNVQENIIEAIHEVRKLSHSMVMPRFEACQLKDKLKKLLENFSDGQAVELHSCNWREDKIPVFIKETFFRVAQEQLNNIYKYAQARNIVIQLANSNQEASMWIKDDGSGIDTKKERTGIGISNIISRVELYNGTTSIVSSPGNGCVLSIQIPLPNGS